MMNRLSVLATILFLPLFFFFLILAQKTGSEPVAAGNYYLKATVKGLHERKIYLASIYGEDLTKIDSTLSDSNGNFRFQLAEKSHAGLYRLLLGKTLKAEFAGGNETHIDIIFNHENIRFVTSFAQPVDSMQVRESAENQLYYDFIQTNESNKRKLDVLNQTLHYYPSSDEFYKEIEKQFHKIIQQNEKYVSELVEKNAATLAAHIIRFQSKPDYFQFMETTEKMPEAEKNEYIKIHFFDGVDMADSLLMRSTLIPDRILAYLSLYRDKQYTANQQSDAFIKATDAIMGKVKENEMVYNYVLGYITKGFEKIGQEPVLIYISDKYLANSCKNDQLKDEYATKVEKMKKVAVGQHAPEIEMADIDGKPVRLSDIKTEYTLVVFWASWCPHCTAMLPELKTAYQSINKNGMDSTHKKMEVLAFSIDNDSTQWKKFVNDGKYNWINCSELKGWGSKMASEYNVYATPTMFLLDKGKKIIGKPNDIRELENQLR